MTTEPGTSDEPEKHLKALALMTVIIVCAFVFCSGILFPFMFVFQLVAGWIFYLNRTLPTLTISLERTLWFLSALILFSVGLHFVCRKYSLRAENTHSNWQTRWTLSLVAMLLTLVMSGICVISITHQTWWMTTGEDKIFGYRSLRTAARRSTSKNNLKQVGIAMHSYHETHAFLPPGGTFNIDGQPQHSWVSQLLPFLDQASLYDRIDFNQPWDAEVNRKHFETSLYMIQSPGINNNFDNGKSKKENDRGYKPAHYAANSRVFNVNSNMKFAQITDGVSNTILAGEIKSHIKPWGDPKNFRDPAHGINLKKNGFGSPFKGGAHLLLGDGRVRFISEDIAPAILKALSTPNGGEPVDQY